MTKNSHGKRVAIIGIGRVGLPMALTLADCGLQVDGIDVNPDLIAALERHQMPFHEIGGPELLKKHYGKLFTATLDIGAATNADWIILTLGTPVDENMNPDLGQINKTLTALQPHLKAGQTIILRSTVSPSTTTYVKNVIEKHTKFRVGTDLFLAFCPERIAEGKAIEEIKTLPQIVGGIDPASTQHAKALFDILGVESLATDATSAELAKLFTNMYRYISFAMANEFMIIAGEHNRDIYEIVNLVNHNYKRGGLALPGLSAGPCLFKDGFFLINDMPSLELIAASWKINESTPLFLVKKIKERMSVANKKVAILGAAFKANIDDARQSLAFKAKKAFEYELADVRIHDSMVPKYTGRVEDVLQDADVVFIAMNHDEYKSMDRAQFKRLVSKDCLVCDIWNVFGTNQIIFPANQIDA